NMIVPDLYNLYAEVNGQPIKQGGDIIPYATTTAFAENTGIGALYQAYSAENRFNHFYYQFNINQFAGEDDQTYGLASNNKHKFAIAMAGMDNLSASLHTWYQTINQAHELGHNLNLSHGGDENVNYKWNYYSMMNYSYSFRMPHTTDYFANKWQGTCSDGKITSLFEPSDEVDTMNLYLNYSYGTSPIIDTQSMSERNIQISDDLDPITSDLNNNGQIDNSILCRIAEGYSGSIAYTVYQMNDFNDWAEIKQHIYYNKSDLNITSLTSATRPELTTLSDQQVFVCKKN
ncbi:MAG: hypothetical protein ISP86_01840, partial [Shewanellaceae bacterium]|nr:hypothetical protein [Shewanellaceae bacterium]